MNINLVAPLIVYANAKVQFGKHEDSARVSKSSRITKAKAVYIITRTTLGRFSSCQKCARLLGLVDIVVELLQCKLQSFPI